MSYILDALKKSEKERQRGAVPDLLTVQDILVQEPEKRSMWPYLLLIALLLNAGLFMWWFGPSQPKKPKVVAQTTVSHPVELPKTINPGGGEDAEKSVPKAETRRGKPVDMQQQNNLLTVKEEPSEKVAGRPIPMTDMNASREIPQAVPQGTAVNTIRSEPKPALHNEAVIENRVYNLNELPSSIQQSLPAFSISTLIHSSDPASRMVKINGQTMREGQDLIAGLKLEEITADGVIFRYHNYRFRVGLK